MINKIKEITFVNIYPETGASPLDFISCKIFSSHSWGLKVMANNNESKSKFITQ